MTAYFKTLEEAKKFAIYYRKKENIKSISLERQVTGKLKTRKK